MKKRILSVLIISAPFLFFIFMSIKKFLTNMLESDIFDIDFNKKDEEKE